MKEPVTCYYRWHKSLRLLLRKLQDIWQSKNYKVDKNTTLIQAFRVAGSLTKQGQKTTCYKVGEKFNIFHLAKQLQVNLWQETDIVTNSATAKMMSKKPVLHLPNGDKPFYYHCYFRIAEEVEQGHRYLSLFALAIVGYKCRISREKVEKDICHLADFFNACADRKQLVRETEIDKAMKGYSNEYVLVSSVQLEEWFGFTFPRNTKRNGRTQKEHLAFARTRKSLKAAGGDREIINLSQAGFSAKDIAAKTGVSTKTVYKKLAVFKDGKNINNTDIYRQTFDKMLVMSKMDGESYAWLAHQSTLPALATIQDEAGHYIFIQGDATKGIPSMLAGHPVTFTGKTFPLGARGDLALIDYSKYLIKDGAGLQVAASEHVKFTSNKTVIKAFKNVDGKPWVNAPIKLEDGVSAVSPYVILGA